MAYSRKCSIFHIDLAFSLARQSALAADVCREIGVLADNDPFSAP